MLTASAPDALGLKSRDMETELTKLKEKVNQIDKDNSPIEFQPAAATKYQNIVAELHHHIVNIDNHLRRQEMFEEVRK